MIERWIQKYFSEAQVPEVLKALSFYGSQSWHREVDRVRRDLVIVSRGSFEKLHEALKLADTDYRDILVGEEVDPYLIEELKKGL